MLEQVSILNFRLRGVGRVSEAARARAGEHINLKQKTSPLMIL